MIEIEALKVQGLSEVEAKASGLANGYNVMETSHPPVLWGILRDLAKEPMVLLLLVASSLYFVTGNVGDGIFLAVAILLVAAISLYQDQRSRNALEKLKVFTQPSCKVIRGGEVRLLKGEELVMGDVVIVEEGNSIVADGQVLQSHDFSVNESILTGESLAVYKGTEGEVASVYAGTTVVSGMAIVRVSGIGSGTRIGQIGKRLGEVSTEKTPLEGQINDFVRKMVIAGVVVFVVVWVINYFQSYALVESLLRSLTLAMSILPEEIPVAFTTFMALGAWRLMKLGIVVKQMKTVEALGSATVICTDKTGTITENKMQLAEVYVSSAVRAAHKGQAAAELALLRTAMFASEPIPFDPMEHALHEAYQKRAPVDERPDYTLVHEYPLEGKPPMMTHVFAHQDGQRIIAAKGAPEALLGLAPLDATERAEAEQALHQLAQSGYRVLGVGLGDWAGEAYPSQQQQLPFRFMGLVAFYDPPKANIGQVFESFYAAGIQVKIITGDNAATTGSIARQVGFRGAAQTMNGEDLMQLDEAGLREKVKSVQIFTRMFPEAKLRIINALKANGEIVAMTGDGVNDGPALKAAHIGIAMGKKGSEIAKEAASLILADDDLARMVDAVAMGRKIYGNLKKAIQYIISIHIPIILTVFIPLALGWRFPHIFSPIHVIFMELIMGPTCSIVFENEPMEKNTMQQVPRPLSKTFFRGRELLISVVQGLMITGGSLLAYHYAVAHGGDEAQTRTMVFCTLLTANVVLTLVNRSFYYSAFSSLRNRNRLLGLVIGITVCLGALLLFWAPLREFFAFAPLSKEAYWISMGLGIVSVGWFEVLKWIWRLRTASAGSGAGVKTQG